MWLLCVQGVVTAAVSLIHMLSVKYPDEYKGSVSLSVSRLSRVCMTQVVADEWVYAGKLSSLNCVHTTHCHHHHNHHHHHNRHSGACHWYGHCFEFAQCQMVLCMLLGQTKVQWVQVIWLLPGGFFGVWTWVYLNLEDFFYLTARWPSPSPRKQHQTSERYLCTVTDRM